ncbi:Adenylate cyclase [Chryseobacterium sp. MOF25P]|uniref:adenylate/guanylate cyclase domain-containing protein n=1 Tax=unclassified Chryseobacterium TaxID=2593645 RepID=UPI0008053CA5|nr:MULTISPECIES: adenylate/guanylate cyclase domain-containing protein [unclassified Chryseobacterium]OBW41764.1 Adenylate cyclase [Chryseobacterium sp. MOF25P]OBW46864.1 Adenylate cyclase [Chryseobacterium sp. BGARF1]
MKKDLLLTFLLFLLIGWQNLCFAQNSFEKPRVFTLKEISDGVSIDEQSKFFAGDNPAFASVEFNDSTWENIRFNDRKAYKKNQPHWIRFYFKVDSSLVNKAIAINFSQLGASEIFLNGKKIQSVGKIGKGDLAKFIIKNKVPTIFTVENTEVNVLVIRYLPLPNTFKFIEKARVLNIEFKEAETLLQDKMEVAEEVNFYMMLTCGVFAALGFIHLLLFIFYRKALYNLFFSLYNISIFLIGYLVILLYQMQNPELLGRYVFLGFLAMILFGASLSGFVNTLFAKKKTRMVVMLIIAVILIIVYYFNITITVILGILYIVFTAFESFYLIIRAMIRKEKAAFIVGGGILAFFVFVVSTIILNVLNNLNVSFSGRWAEGDIGAYILVLIILSFPISISAYLGWQFASTNLSLVKQLDEVNRLSDINLKQEQEKQHILQNQNDLLEKQVDERTSELQKEKQKTEDLLLNILPHEVAEELKEKGSSEAKYYDEVSVIFTDFVNFTQSSERLGAEKMLGELNECFTEFDRIMEKYNLEKIKTIGDAYLAVSGLPISNEEHAKNAVDAGLEILSYIQQRKINNSNALDIRIGIHSGSVIAGIVGVKKFAYDIWGDTVNTAARMEQNSSLGKLNVSEATYQLIKEDFIFEYRGKIETKGKGEMEMYFVNSLI